MDFSGTYYVVPSPHFDGEYLHLTETPKREDGWEAKLAFDEAFGTLARTRN